MLARARASADSAQGECDGPVLSSIHVQRMGILSPSAGFSDALTSYLVQEVDDDVVLLGPQAIEVLAGGIC